MEKLYSRVRLFLNNTLMNKLFCSSFLRLKTGLPGRGVISVLVFSCIVLTFSEAQAVNKTFTGPGNFSDAAKWNGGTRPIPGDNLRINGTCTVDNSALTDNVSYGTLEIGRTSAGTLQWVASGTNTLNVTNVFSSVAGSSLNMNNGGTLIIRGTWSSSNLGFVAGNGTIEIQSNITLPLAYDDFNVLILSGTVNIGATDFTAAGTTTVTGELSISSTTGTKIFDNLIVEGTFDNEVVTEPITITGNLTNNGVFNSDGRVTFSGASSNTITGTATTNFNGGITVSKGSVGNILDVQSVITMSTGGLTLVSGTFKLSSASTITPFTADVTTSPFLIPASAGLWVNGGTISPRNMGWTFAGLLRVSAGTLNVGNSNTNWLAPQTGATIQIDGGALNAADRLSQIGADWNFVMSGGTLTVPTAGSTTADRPPFNMESSGCSFNMSGGTIVIQSAGGSAGQNLGFLNASSTSSFTGGTLQIGNASTPASSVIEISSAGPVYNLTVSSANVTAKLETALTVTNNVTLTSGTFDVNNLNVSVGGSWSTSSSAGFTPGSATVTFNGTGSQTINGTAGTQTFNNLVVSKTAGTTLNTGGSTTTINVSGSYTQNSGNYTAPAIFNVTGSVILNAGTFTSGTNITAGSNWSKETAATFAPGSGTVTFNGSGLQTISGTSAAQTFNHIVLAKTAGSILRTGGSTVNLTVNNLTQTTGDFTAPVNMNINGNLLLSSGIYTASTTTNINGNWTKQVAATFAHNFGTVNMNGSSSQTINGSSMTPFYNLTIGNASGVILGVNTSIEHSIDLTSGSLTLSDYDLTLLSLATIGSYSSTHYFITKEDVSSGGFLIQHVTSSAVVFPVGASSSYTPATVTNAGTADDFRVRVFTGVYTNGTTGGLHPDISHSVNKTWLIEEVNSGGSDVTLELQWNGNDENSSFARNNCGLFHYTGGLWDLPAAFGACNTVSSGVYSDTRNGFTSFSPFTIGDRNVPLPTELLTFKGKRVEKAIMLSWATATETNNSHFTIERSTDGSIFSPIGMVAGAGNSNSIINYSFSDNAPVEAGLSYYRLKQVDSDGKFMVSDALAIKPEVSMAIVSLYPMPAQENVNIQVEAFKPGNCIVNIYDLTGTLIHRETFHLGTSPQILSIATVQLLPGLYTVNLQHSDGENHSMKLLK
jgi:hypothetical protein